MNNKCFIGIAPSSTLPFTRRGVIASQDIAVSSVITADPVLLIPNETPLPALLDQYVFQWSEMNVALVLGYGSIFNHSSHANVVFTRFHAAQEMHFICCKPVKAREELTIAAGERPLPAGDKP